MGIIITIKNVKCGNARICNGEHRITIPQWAVDRSDDYFTYYLCHELAHVTNHELFETWGHGEEFKAIEDMYLADFGMAVIRKKAYPKSLTAFGQVVYCD